ncbi:hypothetical protein ACQR1W_09145 [Bradyrhizobium sp. HKCCYLS1011]|uniref:hypothetical protein n=1 Tax=Bradyrhizobium sp. HKCCYLS1011 TaxID=3420733 RepID=UPI003EBC7E3C
MNQLNSSISSSEKAKFRAVGAAAHTAAWIVIGLVLIDIAINVVLAYPSDPKVTNPSQLRLYFEYGRSTEGQLARMTRPDRSQTAPITLPGWYDTLEITEFPEKSSNSIVTIYGMSHAVRLGHALERTSLRLTPRIVGAPGAPTNWSYGAFLRDRGGGKSRAVVLAIMSYSLPMITTLSAATWSFDLPMPYTMDRFYVRNGQLEVVHPPFTSFEGYVAAFDDPAEWSKVRSEFVQHDTMYNSFIMRANIFDHSSLFRLIRRAYAQRYMRAIRKGILDGSGFRAESEQIQVARAIIRDFAKQARRDGIVPVVFVVNNFGYSDNLYRALEPVLKEDNIPYVSSHTVASPDDPRGYLPDSHFTDEVDDRLAKELEKVILEAAR